MKSKDMKSLFKILLFTIILSSCSHPERKGLSENERHYVKTLLSIDCDEAPHVPGDLLIQLKTIDTDAIATRVISASDSILGKGFISNNIKDKIENHFFTFEERIKDSTFIMDKVNLWNVQDKRSYFNDNFIAPVKLDWEKLLSAGKSDLITQNKVDHWEITHKVTICIDPNWKQIGQFKTIKKSESTIKILPYFGYKMAVTIVYNLDVLNTSDNTLENYQIQLKEHCYGYSVADLEGYLVLDDMLKHSDLKNQDKKIMNVREISFK